MFTSFSSLKTKSLQTSKLLEKRQENLDDYAALWLFHKYKSINIYSTL